MHCFVVQNTPLSEMIAGAETDKMDPGVGVLKWE
jgi:hypothetical protein